MEGMMHTEKDNDRQQSSKLFRSAGTKIYFSKDTERNIFFVLTLMMLIYGIFAKIGLF